LLQGDPGTPISSNNPYGLVATGDALYFGYHHDIWTTYLARLTPGKSEPALVTLLPVSVGLSGLTTVPGWVLVSGDSAAGLDLYLAASGGAGAIRIAQGLRTPAITGLAGITFIDSTSNLVAISVADLGYIGFGHPAP
jgi:hypothetical protein